MLRKRIHIILIPPHISPVWLPSPPAHTGYVRDAVNSLRLFDAAVAMQLRHRLRVLNYASFSHKKPPFDSPANILHTGHEKQRHAISRGASVKWCSKWKMYGERRKEKWECEISRILILYQLRKNVNRSSKIAISQVTRCRYHLETWNQYQFGYSILILIE